ncbi:hypothetical protein I79_012184 [Cricetulus griseus]|uniref:Uncharacterized protein n=1 Tax=Cricetulus griseus TaxID=10029 RepID=G3HN52_CRIGR|nr:hypothetical protein I79_012184 [Cricetulus griseus]
MPGLSLLLLLPCLPPHHDGLLPLWNLGTVSLNKSFYKLPGCDVLSQQQKVTNANFPLLSLCFGILMATQLHRQDQKILTDHINGPLS